MFPGARMQESAESIGFCSVLSHAELGWGPGKFPGLTLGVPGTHLGPPGPTLGVLRTRVGFRELPRAPFQFGMTQDTAKTNAFCGFLHPSTQETFLRTNPRESIFSEACLRNSSGIYF